MPDRQVVLGAGAVGCAVAELLLDQGAEVLLASRSGTGPEIPGATRCRIEADDEEALSALADGAAALYNCLNPPQYHRWPEMWPPVAHALLTAAERTGAVLAVTGNLYPYGQVAGAMVEGIPDAGTGSKARVRAAMTAEALARHLAGRIRTVEVRGSDFVGHRVGENGHLSRQIPALRAGKTARVIGSPDQPHSWTDVHDVARALVRVAAEESAWGRVWHAPTNPAVTQREALHQLAKLGGYAPPKVSSLPHVLLRGAGVFVPTIRALIEVEYQFAAPYLLDSTAIMSAFGLAPSPWEECLRRTLA